MKQQFLDLNGLTELVTYLKKSITEQKEILPYASNKLFPSTGNVNTIYIDTATNSIYRWDSSNKKYEILAKAVKSVSISESTENGKITLTVDGNKTTVPIHGLGSAAYTNSSAYSPAGHTHTKAQVGLGNVDNTADANKSVKHATTADSATTAGTATNVSAGEGTADAARHVWFSDSPTETKRAYSDKFKYNPVTNNLTVNVTGNAATASSVAWGNVTGKPSTYAPSAHNHNDSTITSLNASKLFGTIDIARLPHGALERCVIVADDTARFALTTAKVQLGDTVKVNKTQKMYFVIDDSKLNSEAGYTVYTAGSATSVPWSGVTGKPTTFTPSSHTHPYLSALSASGRTITYTKGDGTTGTITTQDTWRGIQNNLTSDSATDSLAAAQGKILKGLVDGKLSLSGGAMTGNISYKGSKATFPMIQFIDNDVDAYGNGIAIGGGGLTIVGGGEAADVVKTTATHGGNERLILANDDSIEFYTNCQEGLSKATHTSIDNTGLFSGIASSANLINCTPLTNQDLNTLKDPGKFYYAAGNNNCTNTGQAVGTAFGLYVGRNAEGYRYQKMITTGNLIYYRTYNSTSWSAWSTNIDSSNYNSYAPTKTGGGASGTWGISVTGNAATATKLATARSINGTNFDGSGNITTATWGTARNITIGSTKKSVNGSADVSWSLSEIGAAAASHSHSYLPLAGGTMTGALNFANATWNIVGDDVYIGDMNIGGTLGVMGKNGNTTIKLVQYGASTTSGSGTPGVSWTCTGANASTMSGTLSGTFSGNLSGTASRATLLAPAYTADTFSTASSTWRNGVTEGKVVWGQSWRDTSMSNDTGDLTIWIKQNGSVTTANMTIDGTINAIGGFIGSLSGNASSATALTSSAGSATQPVYFSGGKPIACSYTLGKSVPADALFTDHTYGNMKGATSSSAGSAGLVPAPNIGEQLKFLRADGTWVIPTNTTYSVGTTSYSGTTKLYTSTGSATDGTMTQNAITTALNGKSATGHTHNYAGSSSVGGNANAAVKLATARKIGSASFDGTTDITLSQMGLNVPVEITKADYLAKKKAGTLNANTYYNVIDEYDSVNVINDSSVTANSAFSSTKSEKTYAKKSTLVTTTLTASKWTGSSAPYTYVLPVSGATTSNIVEINYASNASSQAIEAYQNAMLADGGQTTNQITIKATEKPTVDIPITIVIRNDL